jgi:hypothetical protein
MSTKSLHHTIWKNSVGGRAVAARPQGRKSQGAIGMTYWSTDCLSQTRGFLVSTTGLWPRKKITTMPSTFSKCTSACFLVRTHVALTGKRGRNVDDLRRWTAVRGVCDSTDRVPESSSAGAPCQMSVDHSVSPPARFRRSLPSRAHRTRRRAEPPRAQFVMERHTAKAARRLVRNANQD